MCTYYWRGHWCGTTDVPPGDSNVPDEEPEDDPWDFDDEDEEDTNL